VKAAEIAATSVADNSSNRMRMRQRNSRRIPIRSRATTSLLVSR
jgi:hypothetical protein